MAANTTRNSLPNPMMADDMIKSGEKLFFSMAHMNGYLLQSMLRFNLEALNFARHRVEQDLKTVRSIAGCKSFSELNDAGTEFCQRAFDEYSAEATKLATLGAGLATQAAEQVQKEAAKAA